MRTNFFEKRELPAVLLRVGLAFVFAYAAVSSLMNPDDWIGFFPSFLIENIPHDVLLRVFSIFEILLALWLISGVYIRYAALIATAALAGIVLSTPTLFIITFRDVGLIFMALALAALTWDNENDITDPR